MTDWKQNVSGPESDNNASMGFCLFAVVTALAVCLFLSKRVLMTETPMYLPEGGGSLMSLEPALK